MVTRSVLVAVLAACGTKAEPQPGTPKRPPPADPNATPPAAPSPGDANAPRATPATIDPPPTLMVPSQLSPALMPLAWMRGDWLAKPPGTDEHWHAAGGALYGIALHPQGSFEVMIVDDASGPGKADGTLRFYAMPGGGPAVEFVGKVTEPRGVVFSNPAHDFPKTIGYRLDDANDLHAEISGGNRREAFSFTWSASPTRAPEVEAADGAFSAGTGARVPIASGAHGSLGYTIGMATVTGKTPTDGRRSSYVTIWAKQADGTWKARFDTGRPVNE